MKHKPLRTVASKKDEVVVRDALADACECYSFHCCPAPHFRLDDISGSGANIYFWNNGGTLTSGDEAAFLAAVAA